MKQAIEFFVIVAFIALTIVAFVHLGSAILNNM